ncbi:MAG: hypothetical protein ABSH20_07230 [Tepidisphaeraceae bacterium]|jgi:hypothetical protein
MPHCLLLIVFGASIALADPPARKTALSIGAQAFHINGRPTFPGRSFNGMKIEGLLPNARLVQGIFDDQNPETRELWKYADGPWDPERNTREFLAAMPVWRAYGLLAFTINLQGGSPQGYSAKQPWINSAIAPDGLLRPEYMNRLERILDKADELGMAVILGYFYFGQEHRLTDDDARMKAVENATDWILARGYTNVMVEIANENNVAGYRWDKLKPAAAHELIRLVQDRSKGKVKNPAGRLLVSTSLGGGAIPGANIVEAADFILLHGNGVGKPERIREMVDTVRKIATYRNQPILFNEDDHFDFDKPDNNFLAATSRYASWGCFDYRMKNEGFDEGFQSVPTNWQISSQRKKGFFGLLKAMTGADQ